MEYSNAYDKAKELQKLGKPTLRLMLNAPLPYAILSAIHCSNCYGIAQVWEQHNIIRVVLAGDIEQLNRYLCQDCQTELSNI